MAFNPQNLLGGQVLVFTFLIFKRNNPRVERFRHGRAEAVLESLSWLLGGMAAAIWFCVF